jgi:DNA-binding MarR family transcriptional regulator
VGAETNDLSEKEKQLLQSLLHKGPALPVELAARTLSFPDDVSESIRVLAARGLIEVEHMSGKSMGGDLVFLSKKGMKQLNDQEG